MEKYFIALEPERKLTNLINKQKKLVRDFVGEQKYLSNHPNITLFPLTVKNIEETFEKLEEIAMSTQKIPLRLKDFHIFYNDIRTGENTITYSFSEESIEKLKQIQSKVIRSISEFNKKIFLTKDSKIYQKMSKIERENTVKYGYPFVGENWIPHITLASIKKDQFNEIWSKLKENPIIGQFSIGYINLYESPEDPILIKNFKLKENA